MLIVILVKLFIIYLVCLPSQSFASFSIIPFALAPRTFRLIDFHGSKLNPAKSISVVLSLPTRRLGVLTVFADAYVEGETFVGLSLKDIAPIPPKLPLGIDLVQEELCAPREDIYTGLVNVLDIIRLLADATVVLPTCTGFSQEPFAAKSVIQLSNTSVGAESPVLEEDDVQQEF
jgi:hypothetical protein